MGGGLRHLGSGIQRAHLGQQWQCWYYEVAAGTEIDWKSRAAEGTKIGLGST